MFNLYYFNDLISNGYTPGWLDFLAIVGLIFGVFTITSKNPIISVLFLIGLFCIVSTYLILINLIFIGISYILVYVGAVSILFLFILMLINIRISDLISNNNNYLPLAIFSIIFFVTILEQIIPNSNKILSNEKEIINKIFNKENIHMVTSNSWDNYLVDNIDITSVGNVLYTNYPIWLILISLILLLSMIGSIIITIKQ